MELTREGFTIVIKSSGIISKSDIHYINEKPLRHLLKCDVYKESLYSVFVYDLEEGYTFREEYYRGRKITFNLFEEIILIVLDYNENYFLDINKFVLTRDSIFFSFASDDIKLLYNPLYQGVFLDNIIFLIATYLNRDKDYKKYSQLLSNYGKLLTVKNLLGILRILDKKDEFVLETIDTKDIKKKGKFIKYADLEKNKESKERKNKIYDKLIDLIKLHKAKEIAFILLIIFLVGFLSAIFL